MQQEIERDPVPMSLWGKDHWSTFAYIETRIVDYKGEPDRDHMRVYPSRHPFFWNRCAMSGGGGKYPTRLSLWKGDVCESIELNDHDDWDCLDDAETLGLLQNIGTGVNPVYRLTKYGNLIANELREWKRNGGNFATFRSNVSKPESEDKDDGVRVVCGQKYKFKDAK